VGYVLTLGGHKVAYCTDLGHITDSVRNNVSGCDVVILESNHDLHMLETGPYPPELQARIKSDVGHLSNEQCASFAAELALSGARQIVLAHLSEQNNTPSLALKAVQNAFEQSGASASIVVAKQNAAVGVEL
jgi:phosphoribosyl 1,2-cyclic phosphodiesterase